MGTVLSRPDARPTDPPRLGRRPGSTGRILAAIAIAVAVAIAGLGGYAYLASHRSGEPTLVVYTYDSLLGGCGSSVLTNLTRSFEASHSVHLEIDCEPGTLSSLLIAQKNAPVADLVVGLDEITAPQAEAAGVLVPYQSPELAHVAPNLVGAISPAHAVTPYEWGYLAIDYTPSFSTATGGAVANFSFPSVAANASWARNLMIEDPATDIVGEEFLLSQIAYYQSVLHGDWTSFWRAVDPYVLVNASWSDVYGSFNPAGSRAPGMIVSFNTDPAASGSVPPTFNATLYHDHGTTYAWKTVYGVGIVQGSRHLALDREFVDWFLQGHVQGQIPTSEWEYPANLTVGLPGVFSWAVDPAGVVALNAALPPSSIPGSLPGWLDEWQNLENAAHP
ncbi:MAG: thiamine ABC transporter substrate-binding protein [Thermoplasmata archaeon]|nr:thiamine ABC transporter substrate-binding protein [Thermoplasmata archaeon]